MTENTKNVRLPITNRHFDCATEIVARVTRRYHEDRIYLDTWKMSTATAEQVDGTVVNLYDRVPSVVVENPPWIVARQRPRKRRNPWRPRRTRFLPPMTMFSHRFQLTESLSSSSSSDEEKRLLNEKPISDEYVDDNDDGEWQVYDERLWLAADNDMPLPPTENTEPEVWEFYDERLWENIVPTFVEEEVTQDKVLVIDTDESSIESVETDSRTIKKRRHILSSLGRRIRSVGRMLCCCCGVRST